MHLVVSSLSHPCLVHCSSPSCSSPPAPICSPASRATHRRIASSPASRANHCPIATRSSALGMEESEFLTARGGREASKKKETPEVGGRCHNGAWEAGENGGARAALDRARKRNSGGEDGTDAGISSLEGHVAPVTSVVVVPASSPARKVLCFCWTASLDGTIRYWDFSVPELMKTIEIKSPIHSMVIPSILDKAAKSEEKKSNVFAYISVEEVDLKENRAKFLLGQIRKCNLTESRLAGGVILGKTQSPEFITISPSGKFFGVRNKRKLHIWKIPVEDSDRSVVKRISLHHTKNLTVLAFHPTERIVAAGDITGRILIWRGFGSQTFVSGDKAVNGRLNDKVEERPGVRGDDEADSCSTWHWHSTEVNVLSFSADGAYLYSGSREGVLVVWQLDTGKNKFLPRIGSPLLFFTDSPDPSISSISCADNRVHILKMPSMEILKSISGIKPLPPGCRKCGYDIAVTVEQLPFSYPEINEDLSSKFAFDQSSGLVALRTENYCIQFYSLFDDREISEVQVCERNHQPGDEIRVVVTSVALSRDGSRMCTTEVKLPEEGIGALVCLKFWESESLNKNFRLSTVIYEPHRDAGISAVAFHPSRRMAVSSSYGGDFRLWVSNDEIQQNGQALQNSGWMCHAVGSYKYAPVLYWHILLYRKFYLLLLLPVTEIYGTKKPMTAAAFSADGSVLAVAAETVVTLWDPENNVRVAVLEEIEMNTCHLADAAFLCVSVCLIMPPITSLSFAGKSECLVSVSQGSKPQLSVWSLSKLSLLWAYKLQVEDLACAVDLSMFAVLVRLPKSSLGTGSKGRTSQEGDGVILLFNVTDPVPVAT
ncbi:hypothetical protein TIFTF001_021191 [Ficus carica]|uniref:WD repeat-containing protein 75 second beta-propeller domain-containing protein n=1 Tax=Ficus carica TaxID=3494 RepID=A0AA88DAH6_FICCA|nr:hypothetical protein TIFTF001_021191 [Ficus carica]